MNVTLADVRETTSVPSDQARGTTRAVGRLVKSQSLGQKELEERIERWVADAKKQIEQGNTAAAVDLYRNAADQLPGAPWLQHRTAELARKLKQNDVAISYFRRAATAFQLAAFTKRAIAPLRFAWTLAVDGLPQTSQSLVEIASELIQVNQKVGLSSDAAVILERTNAALRSRGFSEMPGQLTQPGERGARAERSSSPPKAEDEEPADSERPAFARIAGVA
jgi:tetratricopeptide (TPR) repeat protein